MKHSSGAKTPEAEPQAKSTAVPSLSATAKFVLLFIAAASVAVIAAQLSGHPVVNFRAILDYRDNWKNWASMNPVAAIFAFLALYTAFAAFSLPGAAALTLLGGSLFGLVTGTLVVSLASVAGATTAMLISRYLLRELVDRKFANAMARINRGMEKDGAAYLFGLRLVPVVPFFAVNLAMGLTQIRPWTFAWVSQLGMLPATVVYVNAGSQLMSVDSAAGLLNWRLLLAFAALAALPFAAKASASWWARHRLYAKWPRPKRAEYNMVVIGAGSAGLVSSYIAATAKARVALIEQFEMGGDCLNTGCVPSKALIRSAKLASESRKAAQFGLKGSLDVDFPAVMHRVRRVIEKVAPHDSSERYRGLGVDVISGRARVTSPWTVVVGDRTLTTRKVIIATGAEPILPPIPGLDDLRPLTSETIWSLTEQPMTLLVVGGGAIGCELAQSYARLGSRVILIQSSERLLPREDPEIGEAMRGILCHSACKVGSDALLMATGTMWSR